MSWQERALCAEVGPEFFYVERGESFHPAKRICARCDVRADCLADALDHDDQHGIWGGLTPNERRHLKDPHDQHAA